MLLYIEKNTTFKLWWKSRFNKKCVCSWKKIFYHKKQDLLHVIFYCCSTCYFCSEESSYCLSWVFFGHDFRIKASRVKNLFSQPFRARLSPVSYFKAYFEGKQKKIDPSHEFVQRPHFSTWPKRETFFSNQRLKSWNPSVTWKKKKRVNHPIVGGYSTGALVTL